MTNLKNTQTISFKKEVSTTTASTFALINLEHGTNKRGEDFRGVNQVNTANVVIADAAKSYESGKIEIDEMIQIIESEGYTKN